MTTSIHNRATAGKLLALAFLLAVLAASLVLAAGPAHASATFYVNSTTDHADANLEGDSCDTGYIVKRAGGGQEAECTLRAALNQANYTAGADTINFAIPASDPNCNATSGVCTISPTSALPQITEAVSINGYTQPGASPNTRAVGNDAVLKIALSGANAPTVYGLELGAANSTVEGLVINRWKDAGIIINGSDATGNKVTGNFVGTDASGTQKLGNAYGVWVYGAPDNTIGGTSAAERNVISDYGYFGVLIQLATARGNKVVGNYVGTSRNGAPMGDGKEGVVVTEAPNNVIGGAQADAGNVISGNDLPGVDVSGDTATGNRILSNSIFSNGLLGINVGDDGPTPNDSGDKDTGANGLQNKPLLSSAKKGATGTTTVRGTLNSTPNKTFTVQYFSNPEGTDEGKTLLGSNSVSTNGTGNVSFTFSTKKRVGLGQNITAAATGAYGTSEFSGPRKVVAQ